MIHFSLTPPTISGVDNPDGAILGSNPTTVVIITDDDGMCMAIYMWLQYLYTPSMIHSTLIQNHLCNCYTCRGLILNRYIHSHIYYYKYKCKLINVEYFMFKKLTIH